MSFTQNTLFESNQKVAKSTLTDFTLNLSTKKKRHIQYKIFCSIGFGHHFYPLKKCIQLPTSLQNAQSAFILSHRHKTQTIFVVVVLVCECTVHCV